MLFYEFNFRDGISICYYNYFYLETIIAHLIHISPRYFLLCRRFVWTAAQSRSIQSSDEIVSLKPQISWRQPIKKTVKIQERNNYKQKNFGFFIRIRSTVWTKKLWYFIKLQTAILPSIYNLTRILIIIFKLLQL